MSVPKLKSLHCDTTFVIHLWYKCDTTFGRTIFFHLFIFSWRIIALQYCVGFWNVSTWTSHRHCVSPTHWTSLLPSLSQSARFELHASYSKIPLAIYFTHGTIHVSMLVSPFISLSPFPTVSKVCSVCLCLHCCPANRFIGMYHLSRFDMYVLIHNICFSFSDLLYSA